MKFVLLLGGSLFSASAFAAIEWFDTTQADRNATTAPISDRYDATWSHANVSATEFCQSRGYAAGLYTGHQSGQLMGVNCFSSDMIVWFDIPNAELYNTLGWGNDRSDSAPLGEQIYFWSNRAAMFLCQSRGYKMGFFTGHQDRANGLTGLFCLANTHVQVVSVKSNDTRFSFGGHTPPGSPIYWFWYESNIYANEVCGYHGYRTGLLSDLWTSAGGYSTLDFRCWN